ncbi:kumamolisin [Kutzneria viridogrisea]|uniref:Kumamolisin n=1 Tax=Kutzneria viridogrisea TaxID=47990 RepID=A0ABR6BFG5_9PSEU|nr:kumamolisin [Kutzneria viridogrisea]
MTEPTRVALPGSVRAAVTDLTPAGELDPTTEVAATVVLRRRAQLPTELVLGPRVIDQSELTERYGADPSDVDLVRGVLSRYGIEVTEVHLGSRRVEVRGPVSAVQAVFGVRLDLVSSGGVRHRHREGELGVPAELDGVVQAVIGLDDRPQASVPRAADTATATKPKAYTVPQLGKIYGFPGGSDGTGQIVAILELGGGYSDQDLTQYFSSLGVRAPSVTAVGVDGASNAPSPTASGEDMEVALDIEVIGGLAPGAAVVVYFAPNTDKGFLDAVSAAVHATPTPAALSISWGSSEDNWTQQSRAAMDAVFADAAALGVTVCAASGDYGAGDGERDGKRHCDFPASSPHVLACGGTTLVADPDSGVISSETTWNNGTGKTATGGGVSTAFGLPDYQKAAGVALSGRGVPDVCAVADPATGYQILVNGKRYASGGTSAVAPLWAALVARIAQLLGRGLGLVQPILYAGAKPGSAAPGFRDVTGGDNQGFPAAPGWDPCTGLGSPDGAALLEVIRQRLASQP